MIAQTFYNSQTNRTDFYLVQGYESLREEVAKFIDNQLNNPSLEADRDHE